MPATMKSSMELAKKAAACALIRLRHPQVSKEDFADMMQVACIKIWENKHRGEKYAFVCGRRAAVNWYIQYVLGWPRKDKVPCDTPQGTSQALPLDTDGNIVEKYITSIDKYQVRLENLDLSPLPLTKTEHIILRMILDGFSNIGIANELEIKKSSVKRYRSRIRAKLREIAK